MYKMYAYRDYEPEEIKNICHERLKTYDLTPEATREDIENTEVFKNALLTCLAGDVLSFYSYRPLKLSWIVDEINKIKPLFECLKNEIIDIETLKQCLNFETDKCLKVVKNNNTKEFLLIEQYKTPRKIEDELNDLIRLRKGKKMEVRKVIKLLNKFYKITLSPKQLKRYVEGSEYLENIKINNKNFIKYNHDKQYEFYLNQC